MTGPQGRVMMALITGTAECDYEIDEGGCARFEAVIPGPWRVRGSIGPDGRCWATIKRPGQSDTESEAVMELDGEPGERLTHAIEDLAAKAGRPAGKARKN